MQSQFHPLFRAVTLCGSIAVLVICSQPQHGYSQSDMFQRSDPNPIATQTRGDSVSAAIPAGWRRTANGWEDASKWRLPAGDPAQTLDDWILATQRQEPTWSHQFLARMRRIPPLMIATIQIAMIAVVYRVSQASKWREDPLTP